MTTEIRKMGLGDAKRVSELCMQLGYPATEEEAGNRISEMLSMQHHVAFVAMDDNIVNGWIYAFRSFNIETIPFVEIGGLIVDENYRGHGIGKQLIEKVREWAVSEDVHELRVRTNIRRIESHKFYTSIGFKKTKEQKVYNMPLP